MSPSVGGLFFSQPWRRAFWEQYLARIIFCGVTAFDHIYDGIVLVVWLPAHLGLGTYTMVSLALCLSAGVAGSEGQF